MAATDRAKGSKGGISCFIVDMDTPGVKLGAQYETMMGDKPWEIIPDDVRVPASNPEIGQKPSSISGMPRQSNPTRPPNAS